MVPIERYGGVRVAPWPDAEFIVGNPPFLGNKRIQDVLGAGYVDAIKRCYPGVGGGADLVMWWWWRAADLASKGEVRRFGFVTTNSITQTFDRAVVSAAGSSAWNASTSSPLYSASALWVEPWRLTARSPHQRRARS